MPLSTLVPRIRLRNARAWAPRNPARWAWAVAALLIAFVLRLSLHGFMGGHFRVFFFTLATIVVHFVLGLGPALLVALIAFPVTLYVFVPPYLELSPLTIDDIFLLAYYFVSTAFMMVLIQYLRRAQYQSVLLAEIAESRQLMLLDSEADRAALEAEIEARER